MLLILKCTISIIILYYSKKCNKKELLFVGIQQYLIIRVAYPRGENNFLGLARICTSKAKTLQQYMTAHFPGLEQAFQ